MNHQLKFKNMRTGDKVFDIVNYTLLTLIMIIVLYPVLYIVAASFSDPQAVVSGEVFSFRCVRPFADMRLYLKTKRFSPVLQTLYIIW